MLPFVGCRRLVYNVSVVCTDMLGLVLHRILGPVLPDPVTNRKCSKARMAIYAATYDLENSIISNAAAPASFSQS